MKPAAQQFPYGHFQGLALDIPERHIDAAHGVEPHAAAAAIDIGAVHFVPDLFGFEWIFADDDACEAGGGGVGERAVDGAFHGHGRGVHFANAGDAGVGFDAHEERVLAAVTLELDLRLAEVDSFYTSNFHGRIWNDTVRKGWRASAGNGR